MSMNLLIAPDFSPLHVGGWHLFNTTLQRRSGKSFHLMLPQDSVEQNDLLGQDKVDLIYANPFDASVLVREKGYIPFAKPRNRPVEVVVATSVNNDIHVVEDLKPSSRIALTSNQDVKFIGLRLLEPADLDESSVNWEFTDSYQGTARQVISGQVQAGLFLASAYHGFAKLTKAQMRILVESSLTVISHIVLAHPRIAGELTAIQEAMLGIGSQAGDSDILTSMGLTDGIESIGQEDAEFMIDVIDTLRD